MTTPAIIVHGGAGEVAADEVAPHLAGCLAAARAGWAVLASGGAALDAAIAAVQVLEDDPQFNSARGACLTRDGGIELDAAVMVGTDLRAGAVAVLPPFRHPIAIARAVMERGEHILLSGAGAEAFAIESGFARCSREDLLTERALEKWKNSRADPGASSRSGGTVGAVACNREGHVAAATSTGGTAGKRPGRIGDTPMIGAGTYADDRGGAASATGRGEDIIRVTLTAAVVARLRGGGTPEEACAGAVRELERVRGSAGVILVDKTGRVAQARSTRAMPWAAVVGGEERSGI